MSTQSNAVPQSSLDTQGIAPAPTSATRVFYWSLRRELWENRYICIAPLAAAAVILLVFLVSMTRVHHRMLWVAALDPTKRHEALANPYDIAAGILMAVQILIGVYYSIETLYADRRDRSILFWKSLPVSDITTVLSKASVPIVIIPLVTAVLSIAMMWLMLLINSAAFAVSGQNVAMLWKELALAQVSGLVVYHLLTVHALWHAPFYGWFLLVSSWAKRAPLLWAFLPPLALYGLERILFNTSHFQDLLIYRLSGGPEGTTNMDFPTDPGMQITQWRFLTSAGLWDGLLFTGICLALAIRMRRYRGPS